MLKRYSHDLERMIWQSNGDRSGESVDVSIKILDLTMSPPQVVKTLIEGEMSGVSDIDWARTKNVLAFFSVPSDGEEKSLYTLDIDSEALTIVSSGGYNPSWSSNDAQIAFERDSSRGKGVAAVWSIDLETGTETELARYAWDPDWKR